MSPGLRADSHIINIILVGLFFAQSLIAWTRSLWSGPKAESFAEATRKSSIPAIGGFKSPYKIEQRDNLIDWADNKLRGELTLRSIQLIEKQLSVAAQWYESTTIEQLISYIGTLNMSEQFSTTPVDLDGLPARLVAAYELWKQGVDLRAMYPRATFYRYRADFLKLGIDIAIRQPSKPDNVISLVRGLRPEAVAQVPEWAKGTHLYYDSSKA